MTTAQLTAFICCRDPDAMVGWITNVLGLDAVLCVQHDDRGYDVPAPKGDCGTRVLVSPETTPWGHFHAELLDPEGRQ